MHVNFRNSIFGLDFQINLVIIIIIIIIITTTTNTITFIEGTNSIKLESDASLLAFGNSLCVGLQFSTHSCS